MFRDSTKILYFRYKYKVTVYNVLRWRSESAEGDGAAHQLDLQVFFFWHPSIREVDYFFRLGTFRTELVLVFGCTRM